MPVANENTKARANPANERSPAAAQAQPAAGALATAPAGAQAANPAKGPSVFLIESELDRDARVDIALREGLRHHGIGLLPRKPWSASRENWHLEQAEDLRQAAAIIVVVAPESDQKELADNIERVRNLLHSKMRFAYLHGTFDLIPPLERAISQMPMVRGNGHMPALIEEPKMHEILDKPELGSVEQIVRRVVAELEQNRKPHPVTEFKRWLVASKLRYPILVFALVLVLGFGWEIVKSVLAEKVLEATAPAAVAAMPGVQIRSSMSAPVPGALLTTQSMLPRAGETLSISADPPPQGHGYYLVYLRDNQPPAVYEWSAAGDQKIASFEATSSGPASILLIRVKGEATPAEAGRIATAIRQAAGSVKSLDPRIQLHWSTDRVQDEVSPLKDRGAPPTGTPVPHMEWSDSLRRAVLAAAGDGAELSGETFVVQPKN